MVTARHDGVTWAYLADAHPETAARSTCDRSLSAFRSAGERLHSAGWRFDEVIRTWLYLGKITGREGQTSRYRELNRARADFYEKLKFGAGLVPRAWNRPVFPASTAIGTAGDDVAIGCIALRTNRPEVALLPLENPLQTSAYDYAHQQGTEKPKFVHAVAVVTGELVTTLISGTASITASESRHDNSVERQTQQSLDNIEALIAPASFQRHGFCGLGATLNDLALARVYVKRPEDYDTVRAICRARLGPLPAIYVVGDICRPELLMEVEGITFSHRQSMTDEPRNQGTMVKETPLAAAAAQEADGTPGSLRPRRSLVLVWPLGVLFSGRRLGGSRVLIVRRLARSSAALSRIPPLLSRTSPPASSVSSTASALFSFNSFLSTVRVALSLVFRNCRTPVMPSMATTTTMVTKSIANKRRMRFLPRSPILSDHLYTNEPPMAIHRSWGAPRIVAGHRNSALIQTFCGRQT